jgi:GNAT superfamily N-acetyltransferase
MDTSQPTRASSRAIVRLADVADSEALARLSGQLGYPVDAERITRRLIGLQRDPGHAVFVSESGGSVTGWLHVHLYRLLETELMAEIGGLVVDDRRRGEGTGALLMARAEEWARARDCTAISLRTNITRAGAHAFYEKLGFRNVKTQHTYRKAL